MKAIRFALEFCKEFGVNHVVIESDTALAVGWALLLENPPWKLASDLNLIDHLGLEVDCLICHIYMEANYVADFFDKSGCDGENQL